MPRCSGCSGDKCTCVVVAGQNVTVTGVGTSENPIVVSAQGTPGSTLPPGTVVMYGGSSVPSGWLVANGQAVSRTTYATLFGIIGDTYGAGDGATTFAVPDLAGRFPLGALAGTYPLGQTGGTLTHTLAPNMLPPHTHTIDHGHGGTLGTGSESNDHAHGGITSDAGAHNHGVGLSAGGAGGGAGYSSPYSGALVTSTDGLHNHSVTTYGINANHTHAVSVPAHAGPSGAGPGTSQPIGHLNPYTAVAFIIKT